MRPTLYCQNLQNISCTCLTERIVSNQSDRFEGLGNLNDGPTTLRHDT